MKRRHFRVAVALIVTAFLAATLPLSMRRPVGGRNAERQGYTAGIIRIYCQEPGQFFLKGPQIHFGRNPFNLELTFFEWVQGAVARAIDGPECDSVEPVAKVFSILTAAVGVLALALLGAQLRSFAAGLIAALLLAGDELWLRYSTYTMIENRVLAIALLAVLLSFRRRAGWAALFWALTFVQKPQIFLFMSALWLGLEVVRQRKLPERRVLLGYGAAAVIGFGWYAWCDHLDRRSDLPWIIHTGKWARNWYVGDLAERLRWVYWKSLGLDWLRRSGLVFAVPLLLALRAARTRRTEIRDVVLSAVPLLGATLVYTSVFYAVFVTHEYYAIPLNVGLSLTLALTLDFLISRRYSRRWARRLAYAAAVAVVAWHVAVGGRQYIEYAVDSPHPDSLYYHAEWGVEIFPKKRSFVAMAIDGSGRDLLSMYLAKQRGLLWCASNPRFAPRAFWKAQGVEYVAWFDGYDSGTGRRKWVVRTLDEELARARAKGWSSDTNDAWAAHGMAEWAAIASRKELNPCGNAPDPRGWGER